jgi:hypothetical protein
MSDPTPPAVIIATGEIVGPGLPDPMLTQQLLDHVFGLLEAGSTNVATALEVGLTELDTIDRLLAPVEAVRTAARVLRAGDDLRQSDQYHDDRSHTDPHPRRRDRELQRGEAQGVDHRHGGEWRPRRGDSGIDRAMPQERPSRRLSDDQGTER